MATKTIKKRAAPKRITPDEAIAIAKRVVDKADPAASSYDMRFSEEYCEIATIDWDIGDEDCSVNITLDFMRNRTSVHPEVTVTPTTIRADLSVDEMLILTKLMLFAASVARQIEEALKPFTITLPAAPAMPPPPRHKVIAGYVVRIGLKPWKGDYFVMNFGNEPSPKEATVFPTVTDAEDAILARQALSPAHQGVHYRIVRRIRWASGR